ncbi:efflux RND transporter periplasmic adaptor subunit [Granulicella mallensis]|uniref:Efflux transporter, RND family, MFP subunit n=2 Tax=Granulicella mallensis TaxID=940614 RepID=G8P0D2_GRAMM|nr:efflux RND transporter periplasmic adaptor subunit [Granulicella mallensis]AEU38020.1 efflux transporter, RND family, MFP subunit [Granulicella mallensis MP5ACTX8]MBB5062076.1 membrane fusion protein (multidrug efflux system) [Granulicella mallensis]
MSKEQENETAVGRWLAVGLGAFALGTGMLSGCGKNPAPASPPPPMPVTVVELQPASVPLTREWVATLDGFVNASIQPQASGYLVKQDYKEGAQVSKGQVLFEIDPRPFQAALAQAEGQLNQAKGQVAQAQAQFDLAKINVNRDTPLAQARAIAKSTLDNDTQQMAQQQAAVESAQASVATAEASVANARLNLGFTQVRSLVTGVVGQATMQVGNLVNPQSVLTSVSQLNPIKAYFSISDSEYLALTARARKGDGDLLKSASAVPLTLTLSNGEVFGQKGHIEFVDRQINSQTGAIRIAAVFPNPGNMLRPGQFGRVKAETEIRRYALLVPQIAIVETQGLQQVYVAGADGKAHAVTLQVGPQVGDNWLVLGGVSPGAKVITDNLQKLRDGSPISPHQEPTVASTPVDTNSVGR